MNENEIPDCCEKCIHIDCEYAEFSDVGIKSTDGYYCCELNIFLPTKKQTCKRQELKMS